MTFQPESDLDQESVTEQVTESLEAHEVVLFMKGNELMPQCGYSQRALELISAHREEYEVIDVLPALSQYRVALEAQSGWETIPQTFVNGEFVGGSDVLAELEERGELGETLETA